MKWSLLTTCLVLGIASAAPAQVQSTTDYAWSPITQQEGLDVAYIYYGADDHRGGLVLRLRNRNPHPLAYRFVIVIRTMDEEFSEEVTGTIDPLSDKTGDEPGLFWAPFNVGQDISEVGLRGLRLRALTSTRQ